MYDRVMVVDDNSIDRYIVEVSIIRTGFAREVIACESGLAALEYLNLNIDSANNLPGLIFLDINMPEMNGFEFLHEFAQLPYRIQSTCNIMMLSSSIDREDHKKVDENRFVSRFLKKPLKKDTLKEILLLNSAPLACEV